MTNLVSFVNYSLIQRCFRTKENLQDRLEINYRAQLGVNKAWVHQNTMFHKVSLVARQVHQAGTSMVVSGVKISLVLATIKKVSSMPHTIHTLKVRVPLELQPINMNRTNQRERRVMLRKRPRKTRRKNPKKKNPLLILK